MPHTIRPTDVGKRVTLQYFDDDGGRCEAVGLLERTDVREGQAILHIRRKDDTLITVPLSRIRAGRVVTSPSR
jgi:hypothetical protein